MDPAVDPTQLIANKPAAAASHFNCWRASPPDLTRRVTRASAAASSPTVIANQPKTRATRKAEPAAPGSPRGECSQVKLSGRVSGEKANAETQSVQLIPRAQAAGRQRGDGRCPSGKSMTRKTRRTKKLGNTRLSTSAA